MAEFAAGSAGNGTRGDGPGLSRQWAERLGPRPGTPGPTAFDIRRRMETLMMGKVGIYRRGTDLAEAVDELDELRREWRGLRPRDTFRAFNTERLELVELGHLLDLAYVTAVSALGRTESRGSHSREDWPDRDDARWLRHTMARLDGDRVSIGYRPVDLARWKPSPRTY